MRADYFRMLFRKTNKGIYYTSACLDEARQERLHIAYIGQGADPVERDKHPLDFLAVGDWQTDTVALAKKMVHDRNVRTVLLPEGEAHQELEDYCREHGVKDITVVSDNYIICQARWELRFRAFPACGEGKTLVMYQGFTGDDLKREDCVFTCKLMEESFCVPCLYGEDDYCGFGCLRARDYDVLKGHRSSDRTFYRMGTLILGDLSMKNQRQELKEMLQGVLNRIRCIYLPYHITMETYEKELLKNMGAEDILYAIAQERGCNREVAGELTTAYPYVRVQTVGQKYGFCASGYRIPFLREKDC